MNHLMGYSFNYSFNPDYNSESNLNKFLFYNLTDYDCRYYNVFYGSNDVFYLYNQ